MTRNYERKNSKRCKKTSKRNCKKTSKRNYRKKTTNKNKKRSRFQMRANNNQMIFRNNRVTSWGSFRERQYETLKTNNLRVLDNLREKTADSYKRGLLSERQLQEKSEEFIYLSEKFEIEEQQFLNVHLSAEQEIQIPYPIYVRILNHHERNLDDEVRFLRIKISNSKNPKLSYIFTNVGSANNASVVLLPEWAMKGLNINSGDNVDIEYLDVSEQVPDAKYVHLQPETEQYKEWDNIEDNLVPAFLKSRVINKGEVVSVDNIKFTVKKVMDKDNNQIMSGMTYNVDLEPEILESLEKIEEHKQEKRERRRLEKELYERNKEQYLQGFAEDQEKELQKLLLRNEQDERAFITRMNRFGGLSKMTPVEMKRKEDTDAKKRLELEQLKEKHRLEYEKEERNFAPYQSNESDTESPRSSSHRSSSPRSSSHRSSSHRSNQSKNELDEELFNDFNNLSIGNEGWGDDAVEDEYEEQYVPQREIVTINMTLVRLKTIAKERGLRGYSKYNGSTKQELVDLINNS